MQQEIWTHIPPDSEVVLYLACGDGTGAESLRQRYPRMQVIAAETDAALREQAGRFGFVVTASAADAFAYLEKNDIRLNAWIMDRRAWQDESMIRECRSRLLSQMQPEATLVWELANSQYWRHILSVIQGKMDDRVWRNIASIKAELEQSGIGSVEVVQGITAEESGLETFMERLRPLTSPGNSQQEQLFRMEFLVVRGRAHVAALQKPMDIAAILGETQVCARVRIDEPHSFLSTLPGIRCSRFEKVETAFWSEDKRTVWIWQRRLFPFDAMVQLQGQLLKRRALTLQEWDDYPLRWENHFNQSRFIELRSSHAIQTSTPVLAEWLKQYTPHVQVFPNCMERIPPLLLTKGPVATIFFGALNRREDWEPIMGPLNAVLARMGKRVQVIVVNDREFFDALQFEQKNFIPLCPYPRYRELLRRSDIALLPLLPTDFNRMKSDLKFLECAAWSTAVLASPTVYSDTIQPGLTGLLYETETQFRQSLERLLEDRILRQSLVRNAWHWARDNRLLGHHYRNRLAWYESLFERYDELTEAIGQRAPELRRGSW